ncbi:MAG: hypothetical protein QOE61_5115 [Micromonosporaceae bacterium]|nr:hypothetical protein [Micromonosporaceae bacterium]
MGRLENVSVANLFGKPPRLRPSIRQAWSRLKPLQQALIVLVLLSAVCCAGVAVVGVALGVWTGS